MTERIKRPVYSTYRFWVEIKGITEAAFSECSGLSVESDIFEWEEGGLNEYRRRLPGRAKFQNLVLKRGIAQPDLWEWYYGVITGTKVQRQECSIILVGYAGMSEARWDIVGALPIKWIGPTFKTGANEAAVETVELVHHGFKRVK
jgi:phage tail-like protein